MQTFSTIARNASEAAYPHLRQGLVGAWVPALGVTGGTLRDASGRGNHGTLTNMDPATDWKVSGGGWCLDFDGTNDFVNCGQRGGDLTEAIPFSVSGWAYARAFSDYSAIVSRDQSGPYAFALRVGNGRPSILTDGNAVYAASLVSTSVWLHYCAVLLPSRRLLYVNGNAVVDSASAYTVTANSDSLFIGTDFVALSDRCWNGQIGEVAIYNRALAVAEVQQLYRHGNGAIGRALTKRTRRRVYSIPGPAFKAAWATRATTIAGVLQ